MPIYPGLSDRSDYLREILNRARSASTRYGRSDWSSVYGRDVGPEFDEIERLARIALAMEDRP